MSTTSITTWQVIRRGKSSAIQNMNFDKDLLSSLDKHLAPILHLYDWERESITYGHFIKPETWLDMDCAKQLEIDFSKRPTGGGIVFHMCDLAFSLLVPAHHPCFSQNTLENYAFVNAIVMDAVKAFNDQTENLSLLPASFNSLQEADMHFCMARPTIYDVMLHGKKVAGAAQRRTKNGFLHQGTIFLKPLPQKIQSLLLAPTLADQMRKNSYTLLGENSSDDEFCTSRSMLKNLLEEAFRKREEEFR